MEVAAFTQPPSDAYYYSSYTDDAGDVFFMPAVIRTDFENLFKRLIETLIIIFAVEQGKVLFRNSDFLTVLIVLVAFSLLGSALKFKIDDMNKQVKTRKRLFHRARQELRDDLIRKVVVGEGQHADGRSAAEDGGGEGGSADVGIGARGYDPIGVNMSSPAASASVISNFMSPMSHDATTSAGLHRPASQAQPLPDLTEGENVAYFEAAELPFMRQSGLDLEGAEGLESDFHSPYKPGWATQNARNLTVGDARRESGFERALVPDSPAPMAGFELLLQFADYVVYLVTVYVVFLLTKIVLDKTGSGLSDGIWTPAKLVKPFIVLSVLFVFFLTSNYRQAFVANAFVGEESE